MSASFTGNRFYQGMGVLLLALVVIGFGLAALVRQQNPLDLPISFHLHGLVYLAWFGLFIFQASLIGNNNRTLHIKLGQLSIVLVIAMIVMGCIMAQSSYNRGVSPIPGMSIQQFMAFPVFDLFGLLLFYSLALFKRFDAEFHKRAMLFTSIAIMDPATARIGEVIGIAPFPVIAGLFLVLAVIWHDRKVLSRVHLITWFGFLWVFLRLGFVFGFAATDMWANIANTLFA
mgnify:FL=1